MDDDDAMGNQLTPRNHSTQRAASKKWRKRIQQEGEERKTRQTQMYKMRQRKVYKRIQMMLCKTGQRKPCKVEKV
ncbi:hypothetical protein JG688_00006908 [Phytophthora aleatoria]|uniref:Uncharacterized protein n=1 Tax=Phytophthora aleatoria TaxID=2496075 RepID=A0A8J5IKP5_9STRA|nr:hypothetical protein JG688_00006908 [Phytophthora aleatoria]